MGGAGGKVGHGRGDDEVGKRVRPALRGAEDKPNGVDRLEVGRVGEEDLGGI